MTDPPANPKRPLGCWRVLWWPIALLWRVATLVEKRTGILVALIMGFVLVAVGLFLCSFLLGIPLGLPLILFGALLFLRGLY